MCYSDLWVLLCREGDLEISTGTLLFALAAVFAAGLVKGLTGFGFSLVAVPVLAVLLGPKTAVPVIVILNALTNVVLFIGCRKLAQPRRIVPMVIAGIAAVPLGMLLLLALDPRILKLIVGCVIMFFAAAFLAGYRHPVRDEKRGYVAAGLVSGALNGLISTGGPPVVLFLTNQDLDKRTFRASLVTYFLFLALGTVPIFFAGGLISLSVVRYGVMLLPALFLGVLAGSRLLRIVPEAAFRKVALVVVMVAGLLAVLSSAEMI
jgi:uncharacterized membrane protein YfcA